MNPLIIDDAVKAKIDALIRYAEKHPISMDDLLDIHNGAESPIGDRAEYMIAIPFHYVVVYSIEDHAPKGLVRHLSVSVKNPGKLPSPEAVELLMPLFGFKNGLSGSAIKVMTSGQNQYISIWEGLTQA